MKCPTCGSPAPHLHPAVQHEGEVEICTDDYHLKDTPLARRYRAQILAKRSEKIHDMQPCAECGMECSPREYHPFAACLMFKGCHDGEMMRANLMMPPWQPDELGQLLTRYVTEVPIKDTPADQYFTTALAHILSEEWPAKECTSHA